jgi:hypothetical protein
MRAAGRRDGSRPDDPRVDDGHGTVPITPG